MTFAFDFSRSGRSLSLELTHHRTIPLRPEQVAVDEGAEFRLRFDLQNEVPGIDRLILMLAFHGVRA